MTTTSHLPHHHYVITNIPTYIYVSVNYVCNKNLDIRMKVAVESIFPLV
jgi:hypothetical protein